ncbi:MAG: tRNA guanosine(34) transglycosylase Tgt [Lentisphaerae bacterium]|nr:tRNA guanosine(34) transglycosylase Tgt [Lentisphaerota bacterium]
MSGGRGNFFEVVCRDGQSGARRGRLRTAHGTMETPVFMPVGTAGTVKATSPAELGELGVQGLLANTYHLCARPGLEIIREAGGLHRFMGWDGPILTDSGGYQVFSLARLRRIEADGVTFNSHYDGRLMRLTPAGVMAAQRDLGSDIAMVLDVCPPYPCARDSACQAVDKTLRWAALCAEQPRADGRRVFGIVQGGEYPDLRRHCAGGLRALDLDGYAVGGVSVGEPEALMMAAVETSLAEVPAEAPRYLMGVGKPRQIVEAVARGVDMFDCVIPTRFARNGTAFTREGPYPVKAGEYKRDTRPMEEGCACYACRRFSRAYVRHLLNVNEIMGVRLVTLHNLHWFMELMREIRQAIENGTFAALRRQQEAV